MASTGETAVSILLFAAAPITLLTALSKSGLGKQVQADLDKKLPALQVGPGVQPAMPAATAITFTTLCAAQVFACTRLIEMLLSFCAYGTHGALWRWARLQAEADDLRRQHEDARTRSPWYGPQRPQLPDALGGRQPHLDGSAAGDYGFDPLKLSQDPAAFRRNTEAELLHARWVALPLCIGLDTHRSATVTHPNV